MSEKMIILPPGLWQIGRLVGVRRSQIQTQNGPRERVELGLAIPTRDSWGEEKTETVAVRLSDASVQAGIPRQAEAMTGSVVAAAVWVQSWTGKRGPSCTLILSQDAGSLIDLSEATGS